jgi:hypothetical protein
LAVVKLNFAAITIFFRLNARFPTQNSINFCSRRFDASERIAAAALDSPRPKVDLAMCFVFVHGRTIACPLRAVKTYFALILNARITSLCSSADRDFNERPPTLFHQVSISLSFCFERLSSISKNVFGYL